MLKLLSALQFIAGRGDDPYMVGRAGLGHSIVVGDIEGCGDVSIALPYWTGVSSEVLDILPSSGKQAVDMTDESNPYLPNTGVLAYWMGLGQEVGLQA